MSTYEPPPYTGPEGMQPYPPPKRGMSTGSKVLVALGIVFVVGLVVCCGGVVALFFWGRSYMKKSFSDDPQVVRQITGKIAEIDVPDALQPAFSLDMKVPFSDETLMTMVAYADQKSQSLLMLAAAGDALAGQGQDQMKSQMEQSLRQQGLRPEEKLKNRQYSEKEIKVRGQPVTFGFATAEEVDSGRKRIDVTGTFEGKSGPVMLMVSSDAEVIDEQTIVKMIESIR